MLSRNYSCSNDLLTTKTNGGNKKQSGLLLQREREREREDPKGLLWRDVTFNKKVAIFVLYYLFSC